MSAGAVPGRKPARWRRPGLRALMILVALLALGMGRQANRAHSQRRAILAIGSSQGRAFFQDEQGDPEIGLLDAEPPGPAWLRERIGEDYFRRVVAVRFEDGFLRRSLRYPAIDDDAIRKLAGLGDLRELSFQDRTVTDGQLREIAGLRNLRALRFDNCRGFDGAGLIHLAVMHRLTTLELESCGIRDGGLAMLDGMNGLEILNLSGNPGVTASGLRHLRGLRALHRLEIDAEAAEGEGRRALQGVPKLAHLALYQVGSATARGTLRLDRLDSLERLEIHGATREGAQGVSFVLDLPRLQSLRVINTRFERGALPSLAACRRLKDASFWCTPIGDAGLLALSRVATLERLECYRIDATRAGVDAFCEARPDLRGQMAGYNIAY